MDAADLAHRCDMHRKNHVRFLSSIPASLKGYRLVTNVYCPRRQSGILNIVASPQGMIQGVLHELPAGDSLNARDLAEGKPNTFRIHTITVTTHRGKVLPAAVLIASVKGKSVYRPSGSYMDVVVSAARRKGLPPAWIKQLEDVFTVPDDTSARVSAQKPSKKHPSK